MPTPEKSTCPKCGAPPGTLSIAVNLVAQPVGSYSLAGQATKFSAQQSPVLSCSACDLRVVGTFDTDGKHATFPPQT